MKIIARIAVKEKTFNLGPASMSVINTTSKRKRKMMWSAIAPASHNFPSVIVKKEMWERSRDGATKTDLII